jgi:hypothetical protein
MIQLSSNNTTTFGSTFSSIDYKEYEKSGDSNYFESIIDNLILEEYSVSDELKDLIKSLPKEEKRISIALNLGDNKLWNQINDVHKSDETRYRKIKKIIILIREYVKTADVRRKTHGEILTPFDELAKPMVNLMDKYDEDFWKNHTNKVLDSSAGYGTFLILCLFKFMEGLKEWEPNEDLRLKHIIENQLYYGELQSRSVFSWLLAIDPYDDYSPNFYWGSFLSDEFDYHIKTVWKVEKFDLIIQNPPYQIQKDGFKKTQPLWHLFVEKSLSIVKDDKYMIMVHPSGWRNVDGVFKNTQNLLRSKQILELSIQDEREGEKIFGATTGFDYYILKNNINDIKTKIIGETEGELDLSNLDFIPSDMFYLFDKLINNELEKTTILHSYSAYETRKNYMHRDKTEEFKYPCVYTIQKDKTINLFYSNNKDNGHFNIPKVIWSNGKASNPIIDKDGQFGLTQFSYAIVDKVENLENILLAMNNKEFIKLMKSCDMNDGNRFNRKVLTLFKKDFWKEFI